VQRQREHDAGHLGHRVGQPRGRMEMSRQVVPCLEPLVAALRPPRLAVERAEFPDSRGIVHHEKSRDLLVPSVGRPHRGFEHEADVGQWDGVGLEPADRPLGEHRLAERHREPAEIHASGHPCFDGFTALGSDGADAAEHRVDEGRARVVGGRRSRDNHAAAPARGVQLADASRDGGSVGALDW
jgi:hypothetical protein